MNRLIHTALALTLLSVSPSFAADPPATASEKAAAQRLAAVCAKVPCRKVEREIALRIDAARGLRYQNELLPYVDDAGTIILYPGDTITVSAVQRVETGGKFAVPRILRASDSKGPVNLGKVAVARDSSTVTFAFSQEADKPDMKLVVTNRTGLTLKYSALMAVPTAGGIRQIQTVSCPLLPAKGAESFTGHENWPHPISMIVLSNLRIVDSKSTSCN